MVDVSAIVYFAPILAFLVVFVVLFAVFAKTELLGENRFVQFFVSFLIATIFVSFGGVSRYVLTITPWFAVLVVSLFFILVLSGFVGITDSVKKGVGGVFLIAMLIVFLVSGVVVFSNVLGPYLPAGVVEGAETSPVSEWLYSGRVLGAVLLLIVAAVVSWALVKVGGKK
jgi:hypothetical protein